MLLILEGYCRSRCYCWVGNAELAAAYGVKENTLQDTLKAMVAEGILHRVPTERGRPGRVGIILLRRLNPDLPIASKDDIDDVIRLMKDRKAEARERARGQQPLPFGPPLDDRKTGSSVPGFPGSPCTRKTGFERSTKEEEHEPEEATTTPSLSLKREKEDSPTPQRQRPENAVEAAALDAAVDDQVPELPPVEAPTPAPPPVDMATALAEMFRAPSDRLALPCPTAAAAPVEPTIAAAPPPAPPAAAEVPRAPAPVDTRWERWLADRTPNERQRFAAAPQKGRTMILEWVQAGVIDDPIIAQELERILGPIAAAAAPMPVPMATVERWEQLPGKPHLIEHAVLALMQDLDDRKYRNAFTTLAKWVCAGDVEASKVIDAHRQAMNDGVKNRGKVFAHALKAHGITWRKRR